MKKLQEIYLMESQEQSKTKIFAGITAEIAEISQEILERVLRRIYILTLRFLKNLLEEFLKNSVEEHLNKPLLNFLKKLPKEIIKKSLKYF